MEAQLSLSMKNFRTKAMEVLPLFGVLSSSTNQSTKASISKVESVEEFFDSEDGDYVKEIVLRVREQGYVAADEFLYATAAMFLASKFLGLYGPPGAGKTVLAKLLANSVGRENNVSDQCFVNVGKGWSSSSDFLGYLNPFSDQFSFKNQFFSQFTEEHDRLEPMKTVIFDEASLSSPDIYLSDFFSNSERDVDQPFERMTLSGTDFYFPSTQSYLLTFNFDENTERLSRKFIDRVPILHCSYQKESERATIREKRFTPFNSDLFAGMLADKLLLAKTATQDNYEYILNELDSWRETLPNFDVSPRKKRHILLFLSLLNDEMDIGSEYLRDFVASTFLLPQLNGIGDEYKNSLEQLAEGSPEVTRNRIAMVIESGERFGQYSYI